jgi:hypothetical protein
MPVNPAAIKEVVVFVWTATGDPQAASNKQARTNTADLTRRLGDFQILSP